MTNKLTTSEITIAKTPIRGYKTTNGDWYLSLRSLGEVLGKDHKTPGRWIKSKWLKDRVGGTFTPGRFLTEDNKEIVGVTIPVFNLFIQYWSFKGDTVAQDLSLALMNQSLELRLESSLPTSPAPLKAAVDEAVKKHNVQIERLNQLESKCQTSFQDWCLARRHNPALVHNYITELVVGRSAKESKTLPLCSGDKEYIGLDHYQSGEGEAMRTISEIKKALPERYKQRRKGFTYRDYVDVVFKDITNN